MKHTETKPHVLKNGVEQPITLDDYSNDVCLGHFTKFWWHDEDYSGWIYCDQNGDTIDHDEYLVEFYRQLNQKHLKDELNKE